MGHLECASRRAPRAVPSCPRPRHPRSGFARLQATFFSFVRTKLAQRWQQLASVLAAGDRAGRFTITNAAEGLFAFIRCDKLRGGETCHDVFERAGVSVNGPGGPIAGVTAPFVRMTLCNYDSAWDLAMARMRSRL